MKLLAFADIRTTEELPDVECDLIVLLGFIPSKKVSEIDKKYSDVPIVGLLSQKCSRSLYEDTRIVDLHGSVASINGVRFAGFSGVPLPKNEDVAAGYHTEDEVNEFIDRMAVSNVDVLLSYSNLAYGGMKLPNAEAGYKAYNRIVMENITTKIIHGRLHSDFERRLGNVDIYSVYPYKLIQI